MKLDKLKNRLAQNKEQLKPPFRDFHDKMAGVVTRLSELRGGEGKGVLASGDLGLATWLTAQVSGGVGKALNDRDADGLDSVGSLMRAFKERPAAREPHRVLVDDLVAALKEQVPEVLGVYVNDEVRKWLLKLDDLSTFEIESLVKEDEVEDISATFQAQGADTRYSVNTDGFEFRKFLNLDGVEETDFALLSKSGKKSDKKLVWAVRIAYFLDRALKNGGADGWFNRFKELIANEDEVNRFGAALKAAFPGTKGMATKQEATLNKVVMSQIRALRGAAGLSKIGGSTGKLSIDQARSLILHRVEEAMVEDCFPEEITMNGGTSFDLSNLRRF